MSRKITAKTIHAAMTYVEGWLAFQCRHLCLPALGVLVRWQGNPVLRRFYGEAGADHLFPVASNSKMFTAAAIMQLQEQGLLKLDDKAVTHLPWLKGHADRRWRKVTLQHLLTHSSGMSRDGTLADFWNNGHKVPSRDELAADVLREPLFFAPGSTFKYSNYGYGLLGLVIEASSGLGYADYVRLHILKPLSLRHIRFDDDLTVPCVKGAGMLREGKRPDVPVLKMQALTPAAGIWSTLDDLARFGEELVWGKQLVSPASQRLMRQIHVETGQAIRPRYGLGSEQILCGKKIVPGHGGAALGFSSRSLFDASRRLSVVLYLGAHNEPALNIAKGIFSAIDFFARHGAPAPRLAKYAGRFENLWGLTDIVPAGDGLYSTMPDATMPLEQAHRLKLRSGEYLIDNGNPFGSIGQPVGFVFKRGRLDEISWAGSRMRRLVED